MTLKKENFENIVAKGKIAGNQHFVIFLQCFPLYQRQISSSELNLYHHLQMLPTWPSLKKDFVMRSRGKVETIPEFPCESGTVFPSRCFHL